MATEKRVRFECDATAEKSVRKTAFDNSGSDIDQARAQIEAMLVDHMNGVQLTGETINGNDYTDFVLTSGSLPQKEQLEEAIKQALTARFIVVKSTTKESLEDFPRPVPKKTLAIRRHAFLQEEETSGRSLRHLVWFPLVLGIISYVISILYFAYSDTT